MSSLKLIRLSGLAGMIGGVLIMSAYIFDHVSHRTGRPTSDFAYKSLSEEFGFECKPAKDAVASIGRNLIRKGNFPEAIKVYQYNVKKYPNSADAYENLGEVYMKAGNKLERIETFLKANKIYICFPHRIEISENLDISRGL